MKNFNQVFFMALMAAGLFSCSNEGEPIVDNGLQSAEQVYMQFKLEMPTSRSATDDAGQTPSDANAEIEVGTASENTINNIQLVLVEPATNKVIATSKPGATPAGSDMYVAAFQFGDLAAYADATKKNDVNVIAYCNTTSKFKKDETFDGTETITNVESIWADQNFVMTNANDQDMKTKLPAKADLAKHNTSENPFVLGSIAVERLASRFDFAARNVTFPMEGDKVNIVLTDLGMFNISDQIYVLRRVVDANGTNETLFGKELPWTLNGKDYTGGSYVVDATKQLTATTALKWTAISTVRPDQWNDATNKDPKPEYYFWRYGVENTFGNGEEQVQTGATGIAFKGQITAGNKADNALKVAFASKKPIYVLNDVLYGTWDLVKKNAEQDLSQATPEQAAQINALKGAYEATNNLAGTTSTDEQRVEAAKKAGFSVFKANNEGKYEVYYNYYNRHNDNQNNKVMAPMEFAVVRNNVYKLKVDKITKYGDPDWVKPEPDKPIESDEIFFQVTVKVLPWTVRVNNIEL